MPCPKDFLRTDTSGRAHAGSQRQIQTYVNERGPELSRAIAEALQAYELDPSNIRWVSPIAEEQYSEYRDEEFLEKIGAQHLAEKLREFWPGSGPCWDALARLDGGCVLVEAKSHISEVYGNGCKASGRSLSLIQSSISRTKQWLGVEPDAGWLGHLYQSANRLAHLYFLREIGAFDAYLVHVYFIDDPHSPTNLQEWADCISQVNVALGIENPIPFFGSIFLSAI
ncbi:MAG TPA: hypothetical protein VGY31_14105 [Terriglobia bacterium]|nr:hypothetical protein [Terriglobia bacterium]